MWCFYDHLIPTEWVFLNKMIPIVPFLAGSHYVTFPLVLFEITYSEHNDSSLCSVIWLPTSIFKM